MSPAATQPLVLIGLMATGKSTVGRRLAGRHGWRFVDTDQHIVERHGPIAGIFAQHGEQGFRAREARIVAEVLASADSATVVSLGGGAVLHAATQNLLADALVAFLDADLATVLPRLAGDTSRPLLAGDAASRWTELDRERRPLYRSLADLVIDTRNATVDVVVDRLDDQVRLARLKDESSSTHDRKDTQQ